MLISTDPPLVMNLRSIDVDTLPTSCLICVGCVDSERLGALLVDEIDDVADDEHEEKRNNECADDGVVPRFEWSARQKRRTLMMIAAIAAIPMASPIAGPTPVAMPSAGSTNGNTMYISRQRTVATRMDV